MTSQIVHDSLLGMYLRKTKRTNRDGSTVTYYQLAHNVWNPEKRQATAQVIHNFGRADELDRESLVRLCQSVARVAGLDVSDPVLGEGDRGPGDRDPLPADVTQKHTKALGATWAIEALWERLGIGPKLRDIQKRKRCTVPFERALLAMTANRMCCEPTSKLGVWDRWLEDVYVSGTEELKLRHMYEAMDLLHAHAEEVERAVFFQTADLLNLEVDVVFYDTTNCQFSIDEADDEGEGLRYFGRPKEGGWAPQVVVALAVTREGIPVRSWVFPGNTSDVDTVAQVKKDLKGWKLGRALFVADSGMNSEDNRKELLKGCGHYLLAARAGSVKEIQQDVLSRPGRYKVVADNLQAKEVQVGKGEMRRRYIVCYNPREAERQAAHRTQVLAELEDKLASHPSLAATQKWAIELMASGRYGRYLRIGRGKKIAIDREAVRKAERMDGKWVLMTNDDTLSLEDAATGYKSLLVIERCFRALKKTRIRMQPLYHWLPRRIEAHVKICVLALLLERVSEQAVGRPWPRIRRDLDRLQVTEYDTDTHRFLRRNDPPATTRSALKALDIKRPELILGVRNLAS